MGDSLPPPAGIDLVGSYARLAGADVQVVLAEPTFAGTFGALVLKKGRVAVAAPVRAVEDARGRRLVAKAPRAELSDGVWSLRLRPDAGADQPVKARLLVQGQRPLVLLWGSAKSTSRLPDPRPRSTAKAQLAVVAGRALDGALATLPAERAQRVRSRARTAARRLLK